MYMYIMYIWFKFISLVLSIVPKFPDNPLKRMVRKPTGSKAQTWEQLDITKYIYYIIIFPCLIVQVRNSSKFSHDYLVKL